MEAYKMPFDEYGMSGEGTLEEYFHSKPNPFLDEDSDREVIDRDSAIDRLCLELFADKSSLPRDMMMKVFWPESAREFRNAKRRKGLVLIGVQPDDPILTTYFDGKPVAAFYASYRGVYIAGGYVVATGESFGANNLGEDTTTHDQWSENYGTCAHIAEEAALGTRRNYYY